MENLVGATITHRWLICEKRKSKSKQWSGICKIRLQCGWLRFDDQGIAHCDFIPAAEKRANEFNGKRKGVIE